jgi:aconitate hydratase
VLICSNAHTLTAQADKGCEYDRVLEIDLNKLVPYINGPFTPDLATPIDQLAKRAKENKWPLEIKVGLIGKQTNINRKNAHIHRLVHKQQLRRHGPCGEHRPTGT